MSNKIGSIQIQIKAKLSDDCEKTLHDKLKTYNLDEEINYAVIVLKMLVGNSEGRSSKELTVNIIPKVHYITPFVTKKLAEEYIKELSSVNKLMMFFPVKDGKIIIDNLNKSNSNISRTITIENVSTSSKLYNANTFMEEMKTLAKS